IPGDPLGPAAGEFLPRHGRGRGLFDHGADRRHPAAPAGHHRHDPAAAGRRREGRPRGGGDGARAASHGAHPGRPLPSGRHPGGTGGAAPLRRGVRRRDPGDAAALAGRAGARAQWCLDEPFRRPRPAADHLDRPGPGAAPQRDAELRGHPALRHRRSGGDLEPRLCPDAPPQSRRLPARRPHGAGPEPCRVSGRSARTSRSAPGMSAAAMPSAAVLLLVRDPDKVEPLLPRLMPGRTLQPLRREALRGNPVGVARRLGALGVDEIVLLTDDLDFHEKLWRLQAIGALPLAPRRYVLDLRGRRLILSAARFLARDVPMLCGGLLGSGVVLWRTRRELQRLLAAERHRQAAATGRKVIFLRSDLWSGVPAGGLVAHTAGVATGFAALGADLSFISTSAPALVDPARHPVHLVPPSRRYNVLREVPYFAHALRYLGAARRRMAELAPDLLYQRFDPANWTGVALARERGIPLVLEFNGSEVWIADHWDRPFRHRDLFVAAEEANLRHADLIVVVSEVLKQGLLERGCDAARILVRP